MPVRAVELLHLCLPVAAQPSERAREALLVRVETDAGEGWGECLPSIGPDDHGSLARAAAVLQRDLAPALLASAPDPDLAPALAMAEPRGPREARAALEAAVVDAWLRAQGRSLASWLGGGRDAVECGVSLTARGSVADLLSAVAALAETGRPHVRLAIRPGWDVEPVAALRATFGDGVALQAEAGSAYDPADPAPLVALDRYGLDLLEQPFAPGDLAAHARLARRLETPVCLRDAITSIAACESALASEACTVVDLDVARVGGLHEARAIHDLCAECDVPVRCSGAPATGIGRAAILALASLPNVSLPADVGDAVEPLIDVVAPPVAHGRRLPVPVGPGIGVTPTPGALARLCVHQARVER